MYSVINESDYIAVTFTENVSFSSLLDAFLHVASLPGFKNKSRIWILKKNDDTSLSLTTISAVLRIIMKLDDRNNKRNKVAIVLQNGVQGTVARLFAREARKASCSMDLFGNVDSAVQWVTG